VAKQVVLVKYQVKPGEMDEFLAVLRRHIARTKATEPGCIQFDILLPHDEKDCVRLHEVYADEEAFRTHNNAKQLAIYKTESSPLLLERKITWCSVAE
jgi:autoinducer 2-degrading protein